MNNDDDDNDDDSGNNDAVTIKGEIQHNANRHQYEKVICKNTFVYSTTELCQQIDIHNGNRIWTCFVNSNL